MTFVPLEEIMANNLDLLFPGMVIERCELFRVTRNANVESDEEQADDLLALIESELRERKFAPIVRIEVARGMDSTHRGTLGGRARARRAGDVFEVDGFLGIARSDRARGPRHPGAPDPDHRPVDPPTSLVEATSFTPSESRARILLHHPYEAFSNVGGTVPARSERRSRGPRDQDDALSHLLEIPASFSTSSTRRATASRSPSWSNSRRVSTKRPTSAGRAARRGRHSRDLRHRRAEDALQNHPGRATRSRRFAPLRPRRDGQLSRWRRRSTTPTSACSPATPTSAAT